MYHTSTTALITTRFEARFIFNTQHSETELVHQQVEAYNDGDAEAFADYYAEDAVVATLSDGERMAEGRDEIREQWGQLFELKPELRVEIVEQFTVNDYVVCRERVTGVDEPVEALAVYLVEDDAIQRLWLGEE